MARFEFSTHDLTEYGGQGGGADALFELGKIYSGGRGVETDLTMAHKWFNLAALRGNSEARHYRTEIALDMSKREIVAAQKMARQWLSQNTAH